MSDYFNKLWVEKYRPQQFSDIILSESNREYFASITDTIPHLLFSSPPGQGKTTLAKIIVKDILKCQYLYINASDENGVDSIRNKVITFSQTRSLDGKIKVVILDEADNLSSDAQRILRNVMEEYASTTRFILTANYFHRIIEPLTSRCQIFDLTIDINRYAERLFWILKQENITNIPSSFATFIKQRFPDFRRAINDLQKCCVTGQFKSIDERESSLAQSIFDHLIDKSDLFTLRSKVIENEQDFSNDYQKLSKDLFEVCFKSNLKENIKKMMLLYIAETMYKDNFVIDHEINFYSCLIQLENLIKES
jgi:DNA polymerase III delta prime subunit